MTYDDPSLRELKQSRDHHKHIDVRGVHGGLDNDHTRFLIDPGVVLKILGAGQSLLKGARNIENVATWRVHTKQTRDMQSPNV